MTLGSLPAAVMDILDLHLSASKRRSFEALARASRALHALT